MHCVIDEQVDLSKRRQDSRNHAVDFADARQVAAKELRPPSGSPYGGCDCATLIDQLVYDHHLGTESRQRYGRSLADTTGSAGNERRPTRKSIARDCKSFKQVPVDVLH